MQRGLLQLNTSTKQGMTGSPADLFIGRPVKGLLPGQRMRKVDKMELLIQRRMIQEKLQSKKRRATRGLLEVGDKVKIQDPLTRKWIKEGIVKKKVVDTDGSVSSFEIEAEGKMYHRNRRFLQRLDNEEV